MSKNSEKSKLKIKSNQIINEKSKISSKNNSKQAEENSKKNKISIKDQNAKDNIEYKDFIKNTKLLSDYFSPNIGLKNLNITFRCLFCHKIPKIRINFLNFKIFVSCPKHRKSLSYQEFLEKGYNNDLVNVHCHKCGKSHSYKMRGSYNICLQCNQIFCPECSSNKIKCDAYKSPSLSSTKEKKNMYINSSEETQSKNHVFMKVDNYDSKCHIHQNNQFSLYCLDCQSELCARCHENHAKGHKIRTISKYTVNAKFIDSCLDKVKNEKDNIELVEKYIQIFEDKNEEEEKMKKNLINYIEQDKLVMEIKNRILLSYKDKKLNYNAIRNVKKLKYPWNSSINPEILDKIKNKKEIYKYLNIYLIEGNLNDEQISVNDNNNSQDDSDSSEDNISFFDLPQNNNANNNKNKNFNICFTNDIINRNEVNVHNNNINNNKKSKKKINNNIKTVQKANSTLISSTSSTTQSEPKKKLSDMKNFLCEQDEITIECLLVFRNSNFALGLRSGDLNIYKNDINKKNYIRILKISEHTSAINSLFELQNNSILTASTDRFMKIIKLLDNDTCYKVEYIFNLHTSSVYKGIKLKNKNILSCGINDYLILWMPNPNYKEDANNNNNFCTNISNVSNGEMYKTIKFMEAGLGITDIIETKNGNFACASDILQFWNYHGNINNKNEKENNDNNNDNEGLKNRNNNNKIIYDSTESIFLNKLNNNKNNICNNDIKIYIDKNELYEKKGHLELKTSSSNCLCKLNSRYLFVILSEEYIGNIGIIDVDKIQCINIIEISKFELTSISNFYDDSIIVSCTEKIDDSYVVFIKQYQISKIYGLKLIGQKTKKLSEYYIKPNDKNEKNVLNYMDKLNLEYSKKIRQQINCITYTKEGLLICSGKIESPEKTKVIGEIDLFI